MYRRAVPLMGRASRLPSENPRKNLSGEEQQIWSTLSHGKLLHIPECHLTHEWVS